ncbi:MAG: GxxExxY protein [Phycisphaera sp.]|nr:GxxExxY protein [Phycisphaera sp.]
MTQIPSQIEEKSKDVRDERTYAIIGAAMEVHRELGPGFLDLVYHEALAIEFEERGIPYVHESSLEIRYKGRRLNQTYRADFVCFGSVLVEIKVVPKLTGLESAQLLNYLKASSIQTGLLLTFNNDSLQYDRFILSISASSAQSAVAPDSAP